VSQLVKKLNALDQQREGVSLVELSALQHEYWKSVIQPDGGVPKKSIAPPLSKLNCASADIASSSSISKIEAIFHGLALDKVQSRSSSAWSIGSGCLTPEQMGSPVDPLRMNFRPNAFKESFYFPRQDVTTWEGYQEMFNEFIEQTDPSPLKGLSTVTTPNSVTPPISRTSSSSSAAQDRVQFGSPRQSAFSSMDEDGAAGQGVTLGQSPSIYRKPSQPVIVRRDSSINTMISAFNHSVKNSSVGTPSSGSQKTTLLEEKRQGLVGLARPTASRSQHFGDLRAANISTSGSPGGIASGRSEAPSRMSLGSTMEAVWVKPRATGSSPVNSSDKTSRPKPSRPSVLTDFIDSTDVRASAEVMQQYRGAVHSAMRGFAIHKYDYRKYAPPAGEKTTVGANTS